MDADQRAMRKAARRRSSLLPGMGFARLGHGVAAAIGLVLNSVAFVTLMVACFYPGRGLFGLALVSVLGLIVFWAAESIAVGRMTIRPSAGSDFLSRHRMLAYAIAYGSAVAVAGCILLNFGTFITRGDGMTPVVRFGERILYHKRVAASDLVRGRIMAFGVSPTSSWGKPGDVVIGRILAVPGDAIATDGTRYQVNGVEGPEIGRIGRSRVVLDVPEAPAYLTVPPDCFFMVQEQPSASLDTRILSWARREDILTTKLWLLAPRGLGEPLR
jgi:Signal peptidase, peptidase S26